MLLFISIIAVAALLVSIEVIKRTFSFPTAVTRKVGHIGTSLVAALTPLFLTREEIIFIALLFSVLLLLLRHTNLLSSIHFIDRKSFGDIFLPLGIALAAAIYLPDQLTVFQFGILVVGLADATASLVGERSRTKIFRVFGHRKSFLGSSAFFTVTVLLAWIFVPATPLWLILISLLLTLVELGSGYGLDNLFLPIIASFLASIFI